MQNILLYNIIVLPSNESYYVDTKNCFVCRVSAEMQYFLLFNKTFCQSKHGLFITFPFIIFHIFTCVWLFMWPLLD